jgi:predicted PurR-regulated permease PerM
MREPHDLRAHRFLLFLLIGAGALFVYTVRDFLIAILLAAVIAILFRPLHVRLTRKFGGRRGWAALVCCLVFVIGLLLPLFFVGSVVARQAVETYRLVQDDVQAMLNGQTPPMLAKLEQSPWYSRLGLDRFDWQTSLRDVVRGSGAFAANVLKRTSAGALGAVVSIFITVFTLFYFLADGERLVANLRRISPLHPDQTEALMKRFRAVSRATVRGTFVICLVQATLGGLALWIFGVPKPLLWSVVMLVLAFVPMVGTAVVLVPAAIFQILTGSVWQGVAILVVSFGVIFNIDNLLRPRLMGQQAGMHDLIVFFSTLGGLATYGAMGFVVGPIVAAFFLALLDLWADEHAPETPDPSPQGG